MLWLIVGHIQCTKKDGILFHGIVYFLVGHHSSDSKQSGAGSLHGARTLSTSNPSLGEALSGHGHSLSVAGIREPWISEQFGYHNIPGNRSR